MTNPARPHGTPVSILGVIGRSISGVIVGTVLLCLLIVGGMAVHVWSFARTDDRAPADSILVLGTAQYDGVPSSWFAARLDHAAELYHAGVAPRIVTIGGKKEGDRFTEAEAGQNYLVSTHGVPPEAIVPVGEGTDTLSSAKAFAATAQANGWGSVAVVTDPSHALRATRMVADQGVEAWSSPTRHGPSVEGRATQLNSIFHETGGLLYYTVFEENDSGRLRDLFGGRAPAGT